MKPSHESYRSKPAASSTPRGTSVLAPSLLPQYFARPTHRSTHSYGQSPLLSTLASLDRSSYKPPPTPKVAIGARKTPKSTPRSGLRVIQTVGKRVSPRGDFKAPMRPTPQRGAAQPRSSSIHRRAASLPSPSQTPKSTPLQINTRKATSNLKRNDYYPPVKCFGHSSHVGYSPCNPNKVNQDNFIEVVGFAAHPNAYLFGVCDGHGTFGKEVSMYSKQRLPALLGMDPVLTASPKNALTHSILQVNEELMNSSLDVAFSGSTLVVTFVFGNTLWCANVGDSRAIMARLPRDPATSSSGKSWTCLPLSRDHKPDSEDEALRIASCGGRVASYQDELGNPLGPARVWLRDQDIPGLAMSRSMGDYVASTAGVICMPEIMQVTLEPEDKFIVIGSDGLFEFISNEDVMRIAISYWLKNDVQGACAALDAEARARWTQVPSTQEEEVIDDITCVVIFLEVA